MMHEGHHHDHEHDHSHEHVHADGTVHSHSHEHTHNHEVNANASEPVKRAATLMNYMYNHNSDHTEELAGMAAKLREIGMNEAADRVDEAIAAYREGNAKLHDALHAMS